MKNLLFLFVLILFTACSTSQKIIQDDRIIPLNPQELGKFNDRYKIISIDDSYRNLNETLFFEERYFDGKNRSDENDFIELEWIENYYSFNVRLYDNDSLVQAKEVEGSLRDNYFYLTPYKKYDFKKVILNSYVSKSTQFYLLNNGNLKVYNDIGGCSLFLIFPLFCGGNGLEIEFERLE